MRWHPGTGAESRLDFLSAFRSCLGPMSFVLPPNLRSRSKNSQTHLQERQNAGVTGTTGIVAKLPWPIPIAVVQAAGLGISNLMRLEVANH